MFFSPPEMSFEFPPVFLRKIPPVLTEILNHRGIPEASVEVALESDLSHAGNPEPNWAVITSEAVWAIRLNLPDGEKIEGPFPLDKIEKVRIFRGVGSSFLQLRIDHLYLDLIRFSNARREEFNRLRLYLDQKLIRRTDSPEIFQQKHPWICERCKLPLPSRNASCLRCARERGLFVRTLSLMRPYSNYVGLLLVMMLMGVVLDLVPPYLTRILVDDVLSSHSRAGLLAWLVLTLAGASLLRAVLNIFIGRMSTVIGTKVTYELRSRMHQKLSQISVDFYDRVSLGSIITRVLHDVDYFHGFVHQVAQGFFVNIFLVIGIGFMLFHLNLKLAFFVLIPIPFIIVGTWFFWHIIYPRYYRYWDSQSKLAALLNGILSGIRTVKAYAQEIREHVRFKEVSLFSRQARRHVEQGTTTFLPIFGFVFGLGGLIIWYAGGKDVLEGKITLGTLMAFLGYLGMFYNPISALTMFSNWLTGFLTAGQRIFEILDTSSSLKVPEHPLSLKAVRGKIEFKHVTFGYDPYQPVIKDVSLVIHPGQTVGIVGKSGCGKTTLVNLICRFYDPQQGQILIDDQDIQSIHNQELRQHVVLVLQEPFLFRSTIAENITYGRPQSSARQIIHAAHAANCHRFILKQASGYDTRLGERGAGLSGGERQRISIARALLCDPAILILDEAMSNVDTESEQEIQQALAVLTKDRTTLVIAHRLSTLKNADLIYVMDEGRIIEQGSHPQLMEKKGQYYKLVNIQTDLTRIEN